MVTACFVFVRSRWSGSMRRRFHSFVTITMMARSMRQTCRLISIIFSSCTPYINFLKSTNPRIANRHSKSTAGIATYHLGHGNDSAVIIIMTGNQQQPGGPPRASSTSTGTTGSCATSCSRADAAPAAAPAGKQNVAQQVPVRHICLLDTAAVTSD
jgi:hypothetical protein